MSNKINMKLEIHGIEKEVENIEKLIIKLKEANSLADELASNINKNISASLKTDI